MSSTAPYRYPERWKSANRYGNLLRPAAARHYAFAYLDWMACGAIIEAPERGRITLARALDIRETIHAFSLWGDAGS